MSVSRPPRLHVGDQVSVHGSMFTIDALTGGAATLVDAGGATSTVPLGALLTDPTLIPTTASQRAPLPNRGALDGLPPDVLARAQWWEGHLIEVLTGTPPAGQGGPGDPRPEYDPARHSLRQREATKVDQLRAAGERASMTTLDRMLHRYRRAGLLGLVDGRLLRAPARRVDPRLAAALEKAIGEQTNRSTGTVTRLRRRVEQILRDEHDTDPSQVMPPRTTFYRLAKRAATGRHTFGSAATRRSLAQRPAGPFGTVTVLRPGEWVLIDSTPLDVRIVLDDGTIDRAELTWMIDAATRSIPAAVLRPTTKAVDASLLLARSVTPEPMRPGWADALAMSRSVLPHQRMVGIDQRLAHAAARPVIIPETIVVDHGKVYLSAAFRAACLAMGVNVQPTRAGSPWQKGSVERSFSSVATLFAQYVAGYVGRNVDRRGKNAEKTAVFSLVELQDLLDEWIVADWQNRRHDGLRHPLTPGQPLTPNEQYAALIEITGYVPVPLGGDDYVELLPGTWRVINAYGIKINHRTYDCAQLNPYRRQSSGVTAHHGRWEVHHDPYDVTRVWVRNHLDGGGWITVPWTHLSSDPAPFGEQAWTQARRILARRGTDTPTQEQIAAAVADLLDRAEHGPQKATGTGRPTRRDRRVAARTRATTAPTGPRPDAPTPEAAPAPGPGPDTETDTDTDAQASTPGDEPAGPALAITPLGVFDAADEARKWW